ncbi:MAG TPA: TIGR00730 family Rossman fold protein [Solirubrobacteraceae bacterium]
MAILASARSPRRACNAPGVPALASVCVFCGSNAGADPAYLATAQAVGSGLAQRGIRVVYGGGRVGMMGAVADAARDAGGEVVGVMPRQMFDREIGHTGIDDLRVVGTMHERKALMVELSDAFIALPGGIGTLEELFEVYTWAQLGIHAKPLGLLDVAGYFQPLATLLDHAVAQRFLREETRAMLAIAGDLEGLLAAFDGWRPPATHKWIDLDET